MTIPIPKNLAPIKSYVQGKSGLKGVKDVIKLSSNELPYPPSPFAVAAFEGTRAALNRYPDGAQSKLRQAIAQIHGISFENIFCGNGSEEAIGLVIRATLTPGDHLVISENSFLMAEIYAKALGTEVIKCAEKNDRINIETILSAVTKQTKMVYLCSPNNPTGRYTTIKELHELDARLPRGVLLVLDAAYAEFVTAPDYDCGLRALFQPRGRVVVLRTFSKAYGLASLRIGWAAAPDLVFEAVARIRSPFNTNAAALNAAEAALRDQPYLQNTVDRVTHTKDVFSSALSDLGLDVVPSQTNFVLIKFPDGGNEATSLDSALQQAAVLGRRISDDSNHFRLSIGTDEDMRFVLSIIRKWALEHGV